VPDDQRIAAEEWGAAREDAEQVEDAHREITEHDLAHQDEHQQVAETRRHVQPLDTMDLREFTADEGKAFSEESVYVPSADESSNAVRQAERALTEIPCAKPRTASMMPGHLLAHQRPRPRGPTPASISSA
jgi:hypothetical protein